MMKANVVTAVVQAGVEETEYARAGSGRPVVLLLRASSSLDAIAADPLFVGLSGEVRVVAPVVPVDRELTSWVRGLVDGLGLDRPAVVVDVAVAGAAVPVVIEEDRCRCVVVLRPVPARAATARGRRIHDHGPECEPGAPGPHSAADAPDPHNGKRASGPHSEATGPGEALRSVPVFELDLNPSGGLSGSSLAVLLAFLRRSG